MISSVIDGLGESPITFHGKVYQNIREGEMLPLGRTEDPAGVLTLYIREREVPRVLSFALLVLRSREHLRQIGSVLAHVAKDERCVKLSEIVVGAVATANPSFGLVWQAADEAISLIGSYLQAAPDDQLGHYQAIYTNMFDDLGVGPHPKDRPTLQAGHIRVGYEIEVA